MIRSMFDLSLRAAGPRTGQPRLIYGRAASEGHALAHAVVLRHRPVLKVLHNTEAAERGTGTRQDLHHALEATVLELKGLLERGKLPEAASLIVGAYLMMLKNGDFVEEMVVRTASGIPATSAVAATARKYIDIFEASEHDYMREKASDVEDLALRILDNLGDTSVEKDVSCYGGHIVIAQELLSSDILKPAFENVKGIVLAGSGTTSRVTVLVQSLEIPMVIADLPELPDIADGRRIFLDANSGNIYIDMSDEVIEKLTECYRERPKIKAVSGG